MKIDLLTGVIMQVCDCAQCSENKPCNRVLKVTEQIRKMKVRLPPRDALLADNIGEIYAHNVWAKMIRINSKNAQHSVNPTETTSGKN